MIIMAVNSGGSSIKYEIFEWVNDEQRSLCRGAVKRLYRQDSFLEQENGHTLKKEVPGLDHQRGLSLIVETITGEGPLQSMNQIDAIGIKLIHAGKEYTATQLISREVIQALQDMSGIIGVHNPPSLLAIELFEALLPEVPLVGVFETDFHRTVPEAFRTYGLPWSLTQKYGIEKLGFHGNSHRYSARRTAALAPKARKMVSCHLGSGSSVCAILDGQSLDISSGFTPQSGTIMSTRPGDFDAQALTFLQEKAGLTWSELNQMLLKEAGLLGISGHSGEMWELEESADQGNERSRLAIEVFVYQVKKWIGASYALLNGIDILSFTGGIGENDPRARTAICHQFDSLGITLDPVKNLETRGRENRISSSDAPVAVWVIPANEEHLVAQETCAFLAGHKDGSPDKRK